MIHHLKGKLVEKTPTYVVIECGGVGYFVNISLHTFSKISDSESINLFTHLQIKEDAHTLFGFAERSEREIFRLLLSVSGRGSSIARTMLSSMNPTQIRDAIANGDVASIQSIKGIGAKTAQRVILDLKDKIMKLDLSTNHEVSYNTTKEEALSALTMLGFSKSSMEKFVDDVLQDDCNIEVEELVKQVLKKI